MWAMGLLANVVAAQMRLVPALGLLVVQSAEGLEWRLTTI
jgi:hypothetical protein